MSSLLWSVPERMGTALLAIANQVGGIAVLTGRIAARAAPKNIDRHELLRNLHKMGVRSVPIVMATAAFMGAIMVVQAAPLVTRFNTKSWLGWGAGFTTVRELAPLIIALIFNGRVGANNTAELGTMVVTEQVDALRALAIDPLGYLVVPRVISMVIMMFMLTALGDAVATLGAIVAGKLLLDVSPVTFYYSMFTMLTPWDLATGLIKSLFFGLMIALTSCHFGLTVEGGAPGVGRAVKASVVAAASGIFIADYLSTFVLR